MSDLEDDPGSKTPERIKRSRNESSVKLSHKRQQFRNEWMHQTDFKNWLVPVQNNNFKGKCKLCKTEMTAELTVIKKHMASKKHQVIIRSTEKCEKTLPCYFNDNSKLKLIEDTKKAEILLSGFISDHNLSFNIMDHLTAVCKEIFVDSKIASNLSMGRTKTAAIIKNVIGKCHHEELSEKLKTYKFSVIIDESTDIGTIKSLCICVKYFDSQLNKLETKFWKLIQLFTDSESANIGATAETIFNELTASFVEDNVPLENITGFAADGCSSMMGQWNSVSSRFKELYPGIFIQKCICHSLHLCASSACKALPRQCEDLCRDIYNYFKSSCKRMSQFREFEEFCEFEPHKILKPSQTRWLSLELVVKRILEQWQALKLFFTSHWIIDKLKAAEHIYIALNDPSMLIYYTFLNYILPKFTILNKIFQSDKPVLDTLHSRISELYKELLYSYYRQVHHPFDIDPNDTSFFLPLKDIYLGAGVYTLLQNPDISKNNDMVLDTLNRCRLFIITACVEIKKRYNFNDIILKSLPQISPKNILGNNNEKTLLPLISLFPRIVNDINQIQLIDDEWRKLINYTFDSNTLDIIKTKDVDNFWIYLKLYEQLFVNLSEFILTVLSLPQSNCACERLFSKVNLIKTKTRNKLMTNTLNGLINSSECIKPYSCYKFKPSKEMLNSMTSNMYSFINNVCDEVDNITFDTDY